MKRHKSIFLSDIHLGSRHCKSKKLFKELEDIEAENLFLLGDIVSQNANANDKDILNFIQFIDSRDWNIVYILGNHEKERNEKIKILDKTYSEYIYFNGNERIYLSHGDDFHNKDIFNRLLKYILTKVKKKAQKIEDKKSSIDASGIYHKTIKPIARKYLRNSYINYITKEAKKRGCQKAICGHIHLPEMINHKTITYLNCGDWVNHSSYIIEDFNGKFKLITL